MAEGGEGEDEIQFLRTVSVSLLLLEQNTGAAVRVHCVFLLGSVSVRACVLWCGLGVYRIKGWQLLHIEVTGQGVRIMLTGDQGWRRRENALTERQDKQMRGGERCVVVLSLFIKRSWCCVLGGCGAQCGADWQHEACNICCTSFQQDWTSLFGRLMRWNQSVIRRSTWEEVLLYKKLHVNDRVSSEYFLSSWREQMVWYTCTQHLN